MNTWTLEYINYEGDLKSMEIEVEEDITQKDEVKYIALVENKGCGDGIYQIVSCDIILYK